MRATDEQALLDEVCRTMVDVGGYNLSWIGYKIHDQDKWIKPMAQCVSFR